MLQTPPPPHCTQWMVICLPESGVLGLHGVQGLGVQAPLQLVPVQHHPDPDQAQVLPTHWADGAYTWTIENYVGYKITIKFYTCLPLLELQSLGVIWVI